MTYDWLLTSTLPFSNQQHANGHGYVKVDAEYKFNRGGHVVVVLIDGAVRNIQTEEDNSTSCRSGVCCKYKISRYKYAKTGQGKATLYGNIYINELNNRFRLKRVVVTVKT